MEAAAYDELATLLREMAGRFGDTAFTDRRRLTSLLSDRLPDARREIRVVAAAVDERVFEALSRARPEQLDLEIERLAARLENGLAIRRDVATPVVQACAYGLALGPLPSAAGGGPAVAVAGPPADDGWIGLSQAAGTTTQPPPRPQAREVQASVAQGKEAAPPPARPGRSRTWLVVGGVAVAAVGGLLARSIHIEADPVPIPAPVPAPMPVPAPVRPPSPVPAPAPVPVPEPRPVAPPQQFFAQEDADFHVPPQSTLQSNVGSATPLTAPGIRTVTTMQVAAEMGSNHRMLLVDALQNPHPQTIQGATYLPYAGQYGTLNDAVQANLVNGLNRATQNQKDTPLVFFCLGPYCWESYNAALRARAAGFPNVFWFRGGLQAWEQAGLPMQPLR